MLHLYSDGSSTGAVGEGGWAFVLFNDTDLVIESSGHEDETTNNRMELMALMEGLRYISKNYPPSTEIEAFSDSQYIVKGINEWYPAWEKKMAKGKTIKNQDLWVDYKTLVDLLPNLEIKWHKGHAGHVHNERCDTLAKAAKAERKRIKDAASGQLSEGEL